WVRMPIVDLFSKRQKRLRGEVPDVFTYDEISQALRVQIVHIWRDAIDSKLAYTEVTLPQEWYKEIHDALCREYGIFVLIPNSRVNYSNDLANFFLACEENDKVLDIIELVFRVIDRVTRNQSYSNRVFPKITPDDAIEELNQRFLEHGVGYQYESGQL